VWTKTIKKEERKKTEHKEEVINFIKEKYEISGREIQELQDFFPQKFQTFYKDIEKLFL
jgi:adenine-specific DNA methylase